MKRKMPGLREQIFSADDVSVDEDVQVYNGFFSLRKLTLSHKRFSGGELGPIQREVLQRRSAVAVLLYDPSLDSVLLVEQFRIGAFAALAEQQAQSPWLLELVAGLIEPGETAAEVAVREAQEEAGCVIDELHWVAEYFSSPGGTNETTSLYVGLSDLRHAGGVHGLPAEGEDIRAHVLPREQVAAQMYGSDIANASTLIALQWLQANHQQFAVAGRS